MAINFPNNPAVNDTFTVSGTTFTFTGVKWESGAVVEISSDTTPSLGGTLDAGTHNINNVGVITATTFSGNLTGNADTATTATTAATATNAQGLTGDPSIQVTNATVLGDLDVQGTTTTIDTAVTEVDSLQVDGNVGIGTTNATSILDVRNGIIVKDQDTSQNAANPGLQLKHNGSIYGSWRHDGRLEIGGQDANAIIRLNPNGSVAIGTATGETNFLTTINGDLSLGEKSGADNTYIDQKQDGSLEIINSGRTADNGSVRINRYNNISGDTTYFRDFIVYDGKGTALLTVDGSAGSVSDSIGPLRRLGIQGAGGSFTLAADHAGKLVRSTGNGSTLTIPQNVFSAGDMISVFNVSTGDNTIAQGTGATLYNTADGATGNRTLGPKGVCTILCTSTNEFIISGSQVS